MTNKKFLRQFYHKQRLKPDLSGNWISILPEIEYDFIVSNPLYQKEKDKYLTKGPKVWIMNLVYHKGPLKTSEVYKYYLSDEVAKSQNFFQSYTDLRSNWMSVFLKEGFIYTASFDKKTEKFKGYFVNEKQGLKDIDPQILMKFSPLPKFHQFNQYIKYMEENKEKE